MDKKATSFDLNFWIQKSAILARDFLDSMPLLAWVAEPSGDIIYHNTKVHEYARITGKNEGWHWTELIHPDDLQSSLESWDHCLKSKEVYEKEHQPHGEWLF